LIAKYLLNLGYEVKILYAEAEFLTHEQIAGIIIKENPILAVYVIYGQQPSASTQCMPGGKKTAEIVNDKTSNEILSIVMGTHASALPERTLKEEPYTFVCQGEGPITIEKLLKKIKVNSKNYEDVPGLCYYDNGDIQKNKPAPMFEDLDNSLPGQAWEFL
jgi:hypothetical protein